MTFNKYMHPRNKYQVPPDFKQLAIEYPEFRKHLCQDLSGKLKFNFQDPNALCTFTTTLLHRDFGLNVEIPATRLVPTLPLRLNYILWIEDLLKLNQVQSPVHGIDIGTGASCIYPLLAYKKNSWHMVALENDPLSSECAQRNVEQNQLQEFIKVKHTASSSTPHCLEPWLAPDVSYAFTMCNPPFFASSNDIARGSRPRQRLSGASPGRHPPSNAHTGAETELVSPGGEVTFVKNIVEANIHLEQIRIFTTMLGHKTSSTALKRYLSQHPGVKQVSCTEFCQGHTMRWGLAWTAHADVSLRDELPRKAGGSAKTRPLLHVMDASDTSVDEVMQRIVALCDALKIIYKILQKRPDGTGCKLSITARENTWSNHRRLRRQKLKQGSLEIDAPNSQESDATKNGLHKIEASKNKLQEIDATKNGLHKMEADKNNSQEIDATEIALHKMEANKNNSQEIDTQKSGLHKIEASKNDSQQIHTKNNNSLVIDTKKKCSQKLDSTRNILQHIHTEENTSSQYRNGVAQNLTNIMPNGTVHEEHSGNEKRTDKRKCETIANSSDVILEDNGTTDTSVANLAEVQILNIAETCLRGDANATDKESSIDKAFEIHSPAVSQYDQFLQKGPKRNGHIDEANCDSIEPLCKRVKRDETDISDSRRNSSCSTSEQDHKIQNIESQFICKNEAVVETDSNRDIPVKDSRTSGNSSQDVEKDSNCGNRLAKDSPVSENCLQVVEKNRVILVKDVPGSENCRQDVEKHSNCDTPISAGKIESDSKCEVITSEGSTQNDGDRDITAAQAPLVVCNLLIEKLQDTSSGDLIVIEMIWVSGTGSRDLPHQILQYIKNHL